MLNRTQITPALYDYIFDVSLREPEVLRRLREETSRMPESEMLIPAEQGQFLNLLVQAIGAKKTLEVGVFTGYSALWTALGLPPDGILVGCDVSEEWTGIARRYWHEAGVTEKIDLRLGTATETLDCLLREGQGNTFDFVFIDADKVNYLDYYERALQLVRPGGLIALDNMLRSGDVLDPKIKEPGTVAIKELNEKLHHDERIVLSLLPVADGLTLALRRA
ncbi:MAG: class I SAM-dependent methyltransferase [Acidobacteria bacterium]|nr:class I SAM-dependent methyltransferase [Acidobacteriota bacterium]